MDDAALRDQVEAKVSAKFSSILEGMVARQTAENALSDAEWLERHSKSFVGMAPGLDSHSAEFQTQLLASRRHQNMDPNDIIRFRCDELMPFVVLARDGSDSSSPLSEEQFRQARFLLSSATISTGLVQLKAFIERTTHPWKGLVAAKLVENAELHLGEIEILRKPGITRDELEAVSARSSARSKELLQTINDVARPPAP